MVRRLLLGDCLERRTAFGRARHAGGTRIALMTIASETIALILIHPSIIHLKLVVAAMLVIARRLLCASTIWASAD